MNRKERALIRKKDRKKFIRGTIEALILISLLVFMINALFSFETYKPYQNITERNDLGFIAVSYFGVDRTGTDTLISTENLEKQLKALKDNGYVTISQQDIIDYYKNNKKLPAKSLFLMFEDGRTDTQIFSQKITREYNFKSTIFTYGDRLEEEDPKFLTKEDITKMQDDTYLELGTNGYRLSYINVFDKDGNYLGNFTPDDFSEIRSKVRRDYNHYLMDYIRDEDDIPSESYGEMKNRIAYDYNKIIDIYTEELGGIPKVYTLMHSNTTQFATNDRVSEINEEWIKKLFEMNFN